MKKVIRIFTSSILRFTLFMVAVTAALAATFGSPDVIKDALGTSNLYDNAITGVLNSFEESQGERRPGQNEQESEQPEPSLANEDSKPNLDGLKEATRTALPPDVLRGNAEQVIDGIYRWLNGEVAMPDFRLDLTEAKERFIVASGEATERHVAGLGVCGPNEDLAAGSNENALEWNCRPASVTPAMARAQAEEQLRNEKFLEDPIITADDLKNKKGQVIFAENRAPEVFQHLNSLPLILLITSMVLAAIVFFLSESRRQGVNHLARVLIGTGIFLLLTTWLLSFLFDRAARPDGLIGRSLNNEFQASGLEALRFLNSQYNQTVLFYSLIYVALGVGALVILRFWWRPQAVAITDKAGKPAKDQLSKEAVDKTEAVAASDANRTKEKDS